MGVPVHIIEPCGFILSDRRLRRSGMDYLDTATIERHASWQNFQQSKLTEERYILLTPDSHCNYVNFDFRKNDVLIVGQESCGVPDDVHHTMDAHVCISMRDGYRSLNMAIAAAMVLGEALRQTELMPSP